MPTPDLPRQIGGRYRTIRLIAKGGMGAVYEVEHLHTSERMALKVLLSQLEADPTAVERFKREARVGARIKSENVVRVTDAGVAEELDGSAFLVMELLDGADLEHLTKGAPQPPARVVEWLRQVARALDKAHELGIIHRDLKPENLFLTQREDGSPLVKILDFGIAKILAERGATTASGQIIGTPAFMAPEQLSVSDAPITPAVDRYAVGLIAYRLLLGRNYRVGKNAMQIMGEAMSNRVVPPSERGSHLGTAFDTWFLRACNPKPEQRFATLAEQIQALAESLEIVQRLGDTPPTPAATAQLLEEVGNASTVLATPQQLGRSKTTTKGLRVTVLAIAGGIGLGAAGLAVWLWIETRARGQTIAVADFREVGSGAPGGSMSAPGGASPVPPGTLADVGRTGHEDAAAPEVQLGALVPASSGSMRENQGATGNGQHPTAPPSGRRALPSGKAPKPVDDPKPGPLDEQK